VEVVARAQRGVFEKAGYPVDDVTWAIVTLADGAVVNLGICYALPAKYPPSGRMPGSRFLGRRESFCSMMTIKNNCSIRTGESTTAMCRTTVSIWSS